MPTHQSSNPKVGVLLTNLGTPDSPSIADVRKYLDEFLSDPRVVKLPRLLWWPILNFIILNTRPKRSAAAYQKVWTKTGSPLLEISKQQASAIKTALQKINNNNIVLELAMRYGNPSISHGLDNLKARGVEKVIVLPLYPQFSDTTTSSTRDAVELNKQKTGFPQHYQFIEHYYNHPAYIAALASSVREHWENNERAEKIVMSFHGIPADYIDAGDPYAEQCTQTAKLLADALNLKQDEWLLTFQSRMGAKKWLQPYTDKTLAELASNGIKNIQIMCPGFSADCLETLEEIQMENREVFMQAGGEHYAYIPCLNDRADHIDFLASLILDKS